MFYPLNKDPVHTNSAGVAIERPARPSYASDTWLTIRPFKLQFGDIKYIHDFVPPSHFQNFCIFSSRNSACHGEGAKKWPERFKGTQYQELFARGITSKF